MDCQKTTLPAPLPTTGGRAPLQPLATGTLLAATVPTVQPSGRSTSKWSMYSKSGEMKFTVKHRVTVLPAVRVMGFTAVTAEP